MSQSLSTTPRRSAGIAADRTWRAHSVAAHSAGYTDGSVARRAGIAVAAGLVTLGGAAPLAHANGSAPVGASTTTVAPVASTSSTSSTTSSAGTRTTTVALNVRTGAGTQFTRVTTLPVGTTVTTTGTTTTDWTQIDYNGAKRWVATRYLSDGAPHGGSAPAGTKTTTVSAKTVSASVNTAGLSAKRAAIVKAAYSGIGSAYVYGGTKPGAWDCSGFTQWVYAQAGISLPRTSQTQPSALTRTSNPQPGDLVQQNGGGHVGIYVGNGMMISALNPSQGTQLHPVSWMPVSGYFSIG